MRRFGKKTTAFLLAAAMTAAPVAAEIGSFLSDSSGIIANAKQEGATFVKFTSESQLAEECIAQCTFEEAKAWCSAHLNEIKAGLSDYEYAIVGYSDADGMYHALKIFSNTATEDFNNQYASNDNTFDDFDGWLSWSYSDDAIFYLCVPTPTELTVGAVYNIGDAIQLSSDAWIVNCDFSDGSVEEIAAGCYILPSFGYASAMDTYFTDSFLDDKNSSYRVSLEYVMRDGHSEYDTVQGIRCTGGDGSESDPYTFAYFVSPEINNASLALTDGFEFHFYVDNIKDATGYTMAFSGACDEDGAAPVALSSKVVDNQTLFYGTANVDPKNIKKNVTATLYKNGDTTTPVASLTSTVDKYLDAALSINKDRYTELMLKSTRIYGYAADEYFNGADDNVSQLIEDNYVPILQLNSEDFVKNRLGQDGNGIATRSEQLGSNKISLVLNSKAILRVYSENGSSGENAAGKYIDVKGLTPVTMGVPVTIDGYSVSGFVWVYRVLTSEDQAFHDRNVNMAKALWAYMFAGAVMADD
ncbi:MAG: hypothetical protein K5695_01875 [Oscillospiraceae bacterium]|nr:hypothetical protein [Oscillospiraceae bacterium]